MKKNTKEEEREVVKKALSKSEMLEVSEDGLLIQKKDKQGVDAECLAISIVLDESSASRVSAAPQDNQESQPA